MLNVEGLGARMKISPAASKLGADQLLVIYDGT
jgi:hypothetical protein